MDKKKFVLGGREFVLSRAEVERRMAKIQPKPVGKYQVAINAVLYPPKQVIAEALGKELVSFTTMDATRILSALGFDVQRPESQRTIVKNESELLFEEYLEMSGFSNFRYQHPFPDKSRRPDYALTLEGHPDLIFEVKEFQSTTEDFRFPGGAYDPYKRIREKIREANEQLKEYKEFSCSLVLFNRGKPLVDLSWRFIYGAMLGNIGFRVPVSAEMRADTEQSVRDVFMGGGSMIRYKDGQPMEPQKQTISALIVLELYPIGDKRFDSYIRGIEGELGRALSYEEEIQLAAEAQRTERDITLTQLRAVVHENPDARIPLPYDVFCGPYDERYGRDVDRRIRRLYAGGEILKLENARPKLGDAVRFPGQKGRHLDSEQHDCPGREFEVTQAGPNGVYIRKVCCKTCKREISATDNRIMDWSIIP